jgi:hypothetical protein
LAIHQFKKAQLAGHGQPNATYLRTQEKVKIDQPTVAKFSFNTTLLLNKKTINK